MKHGQHICFRNIVRLAALSLAGASICAASAAYASSAACAPVPNIATAVFEMDGTTHKLASNLAELHIVELLDLRLRAARTDAAVTSDAITGVAFSLANGGNGAEYFRLAAEVQGAVATPQGFAVDVDENGAFDPAVDRLLPKDSTTPNFAAGATMHLLALVRGVSGIAGSGILAITAAAATGSGTPGAAFAGAGDGGCDAVVGSTRAFASIGVTLQAGPAAGDPARISLIKTQNILAADGSRTPGSGAIITYALEARFDGDAVVRGVRLADPIPAGTTYKPGTLRLDELALSDAADGDAGTVDTAGVQVTLGDVASPATHIIRFSVIIQ